MRDQRAVAARDHQVVAVLDVLEGIECREIGRLDALPVRDAHLRHRVPRVRERRLGECRCRRDVEAAARGVLHLPVHALGDRAQARSLRAAHAPRAVVEMPRELVGHEVEVILSRVGGPGIHVRRMQPRAAAVPGHAEARIGEGAPADAVARLEHEHGNARGHEFFRGREPGAAGADHEHVGRRHLGRETAADAAEQGPGADALKQLPAIQHAMALRQIRSLRR
jgi:hypothetical protein